MNAYKWPLIITIILLSYGCATPSTKGPDRGIVVERNKQARPAWTDYPQDRFTITENETRFHFNLLGELDLPLAIKKAQISAVEASFPLWIPEFEKAASSVPQITTLRSEPKNAREMENLLKKVATIIHAKLTQIEDIYFEKLKAETAPSVSEHEANPYSFDVHALVKVKPIDPKDLQDQLGKALSSSLHSEIRAAGRELVKATKKQ